MTVITVGGQVGAGAPEIGARLAAALGVDYVERLASRMVAARLKATAEAVWLKESRYFGWRDRVTGFLDRWVASMGTYGWSSEPWGNAMFLEDPYYRAALAHRPELRTSPHHIPDDERCHRGRQHWNGELGGKQGRQVEGSQHRENQRKPDEHEHTEGGSRGAPLNRPPRSRHGSAKDGSRPEAG